MAAIHVFTLAVALIFSSLFLRRLFLETKKTNKNLPPSIPFSLPIIGHLHHLKKYSLPLHQSLARISARYGPILLLRFGTRRVLIVSSMPLAEECFTTNDAAFANRPMLPSIRILSYNHTAFPFANYGPLWRDMRRIATIEALSGRCLAHFSDVRADEARTLARQLFRDTALDHNLTRVELRLRLFGLTMNVISRMISGRRCYENEDEKDEARLFMEKMEELFAILGTSNVGDFLPGVIGWLARWRSERRIADVHHYFRGFVQGIIEERRLKRREEEMTGSQNLMDVLLSLQNDLPEQYTDHHILAFFVSLFAAGTDTSANTIEWAISLLLNNPEKFEKARKEIDDLVGNTRLVEESDLSKLEYLHCIINETLRMYPIGPLLLPHESMEECKVGGFDVPCRTILLVNAYAIHRDTKTCSEPTTFLPERFEKMNMEGVKMIPFGMGRRRCPGEGLAMREVGLVLGILIQCFEWRRVGHEEVDMKEGSGLALVKAIPVKALCRPRQSMTTLLSQL